MRWSIKLNNCSLRRVSIGTKYLSTPNGGERTQVHVIAATATFIDLYFAVTLKMGMNELRGN